MGLRVHAPSQSAMSCCCHPYLAPLMPIGWRVPLWLVGALLSLHALGPSSEVGRLLLTYSQSIRSKSGSSPNTHLKDILNLIREGGHLTNKKSTQHSAALPRLLCRISVHQGARKRILIEKRRRSQSRSQRLFTGVENLEDVQEFRWQHGETDVPRHFTCQLQCVVLVCCTHVRSILLVLKSSYRLTRTKNKTLYRHPLAFSSCKLRQLQGLLRLGQVTTWTEAPVLRSSSWPRSSAARACCGICVCVQRKGNQKKVSRGSRSSGQCWRTRTSRTLRCCLSHSCSRESSCLLDGRPRSW